MEPESPQDEGPPTSGRGIPTLQPRSGHRDVSRERHQAGSQGSLEGHPAEEAQLGLLLGLWKSSRPRLVVEPTTLAAVRPSLDTCSLSRTRATEAYVPGAYP